jgi:hypothetical protein
MKQALNTTSVAIAYEQAAEVILYLSTGKVITIISDWKKFPELRRTWTQGLF